MHLWQGIGHVPSPNLDMYLGLAEAYDMYTVFSFLQRYLATFPLVLLVNYTVQVYCNNKGLVDQLNRKATHKYPGDAIKDNYQIIGEIQQTIQNLQLITITINHVKGHQDKAKLDWPLTIPETLNIDCDKWASKAMLTYPDTTPTNHPTKPTGYPHLIIDRAIQFQQMQQQLHTTATKSEYQKYLQTKFLWHAEQYESIQWQAFQIAFQRLATNKRKIISKLTHEWLPLQVSHIMANASDQQNCPSCQQLLETPEHFLQCPHPIRQGMWDKFQQGILKITIKHNLLQTVQDAITEGYWNSRDPT